MQLRQQDRVVQTWECKHLDSSLSFPLDLSCNLVLSTAFFTSSVSHPQQGTGLLLLEVDIKVLNEGGYIIGFRFLLEKLIL